MHCRRLEKENLLFWGRDQAAVRQRAEGASSSLRLESLPPRSHGPSSGRHPSVPRGAIQSARPVWLRVVSGNVGSDASCSPQPR